MKKILKFWKERRLILDGVINTLFGNKEIGAMAKEREEICNKCDFIDPDGTGPEVVLKGKPACSFCGCNIYIMTRAIGKECYLNKWPAIKVDKKQNDQ